jgi:hypothetical protein
MDELTADPTSLLKRGEAAGGYVKGNAGATEIILRQLPITH